MSLKTAIIKGDLETIKMAVAQNKALLFESIEDGTLLSLAAWHGQIDIVTYLVTAGADINDQTNSTRQTPLMRAASYGHFEVIKYLLTLPGINLNLKSRSGKTALKYVINEDNGHEKYFLSAEKLLEAGALVDTEDSSEPALFLARNDKMFNLLLSHSPNLEARNSNGKTILLELCEKTNKNTLSRLQNLMDFTVNLAAVDKQGNSALMLVEKNSELALAKFRLLLAAGARIDHVSHTGDTVFSKRDQCPVEVINLLVEAAIKQESKVPSEIIWFYYQQKDWVKIILMLKGMSLEEREKLIDKNGRNLLECSILEIGDEVPEELMFLFELSTPCSNKRSYLNLALQNQCFKAASKLLRAGANINEKDDNDKSLLMKFLKLQKKAVVSFLLENGADANVISKQNDTALLIAAESYGNIGFLPQLLESNVTINHINQDNMTALYILVVMATDHFEYKEAYLKAIKLFLDKGGDPTIKCGWRKTSCIECTCADYRELLETYTPQTAESLLEKINESPSKMNFC